MNPGRYTMSMQDYQRDPCPSPSLSSGLVNILNTESPKHAWFAHPKLNPNYKSKEANEFDRGACAHAVLLEGEGLIYAIEAPDWRTKAAQEARNQAREAGKIPILAHKLPAIRAMADTARAALLQFERGPIDLTSGVAEEALIWQEGDVWCRARPDWRRPKLMLDYKTTAGSAEAGAWIRNQMMPMGYDVQALHYLRGEAALGGDPLTEFVFLVQENEPPFECSFVGMSPGTLEIAQRKWDYALALFGECLKKNKWNGYPKRIAYAEPMAWHIDEDEQRRLTFDERLDYALA